MSWLVLCSFLASCMALLRWGNPKNNQDFARLYSWGALKLFGIQLEVEGIEHLRSQPCVFVANHQSFFDMATFGKILPDNTIGIGKQEIKWMPGFGLFFVGSGNIIINRKKKVHAVTGLLQAVEEMKKRGVSIWIFPEGTRNKSGMGLLPFKKGAFHMASQAGVPIVPIVSSPLDRVFSWKRRYLQKGVVKIKILPPVLIQGVSKSQVEKLAQDVRQAMLDVLNTL